MLFESCQPVGARVYETCLALAFFIRASLKSGQYCALALTNHLFLHHHGNKSFFCKTSSKRAKYVFQQHKRCIVASVIVHYSKRHKGFLVRLIQTKEKFFVNVFTGKGALHSFSFSSLTAAQNFLNSFIKSFNKI